MANFGQSAKGGPFAKISKLNVNLVIFTDEKKKERDHLARQDTSLANQPTFYFLPFAHYAWYSSFAPVSYPRFACVSTLL